jgi:6-phosphogluconolactonase (cycloisomerase 2 family)
MLWRRLALFFTLILSASAFSQTTPRLTMFSPFLIEANESGYSNIFSGAGPIHIVATASSPNCDGGIAAILIYTGDNQIGYETYSSYVDVQLALAPAYYQLDLKTFDNCGGVADINLQSYVRSSTGTVVVNQPEMNTVYTSPVVFNASATTTCSAGVSAMGIYTAWHQLAYSVNASSLNTTLNLAPGTYNVVVEEWDNCNNAVATPVTITVVQNDGNPTDDGIPAKPEFVYMPRTGSPWIDGFWDDPDSCGLDTISGSPFPAHYKPYGTAGDPLGQYMFAVNQDSQDVNIYTIDPNTGGLTQIADSPVAVPQSGSLHPTAIVVDAKGRFIYVALGNVGDVGEIAAYTLNSSSGNLTPIAGSPFKMKNNAAGPTWANYLAVEATGNYLYSSDSASVSAFKINQTTGALTELANSPYTANGHFSNYAGTEDIIVDPSNAHLYTANAEDSISGWTIDASNGELTEIAGSPWIDPTLPQGQGIGFSPASITIDAQGSFMFGLDSGAEQISIWTVDTSTGVVAFQSDEHNGQLVPDPLDKIRVVSGSNCLVDSQADALSFDPTTGTTTIVPGSPFALPGSGQQPGIAIAP